MIEEFISQFSDKKIEGVKKIGREYYLVSKKLDNALKKISVETLSAGVFLGEEKRKEFSPSLALLEILSKDSGKKLFVDKKAEWLYLCGRDLMAKSIIKSNVKKGLVLVQNENDENLGLGKITGDVNLKSSRIVVNNILDRGDFLRREK